MEGHLSNTHQHIESGMRPLQRLGSKQSRDGRGDLNRQQQAPHVRWAVVSKATGLPSHGRAE